MDIVPVWLEGPVALLTGLVVVYVVARFVFRPAYSHVIRRREPSLATPVARILYYVTLVAGVGIALRQAGYGQAFGVLGTIAAAGTLAIGFAMKDTINAFVSGIFLLLDRPFEIGDWIEWDSREGVVRDIQLRTTKVETFNNELLTVPNDVIANSTIKNYYANDQLRVVLTFGIGYEEDIGKAAYEIKQSMENVEEIADDPDPSVRLAALGDSTVDLKAFLWIDDPKESPIAAVKAEVLENVKNRFEELGIEMPYPTQSIRDSEITVRKE